MSAIGLGTDGKMTTREYTWCIDLAEYSGWHVMFVEAGYQLFGAGFLNTNGRTYKACERILGYALRVWESKYGAFTQETEEYAGKVLTWAIKRAHEDAGGDQGKARAFFYALVKRLVNDEKVDAGFKRRLPVETVEYDINLKGVPR